MNKYPIKFETILKKNIWGGSKICHFKNLDIQEDGIGESWELSEVPGSVSVVSNGEYKGKSLTELIKSDPEALMGKSVHDRFGNEFPLLIKFIDAKDNLSIQVHPNDDLARKRHNSFGKTEMWYVISSALGARLVSGFSKQIDSDEYEQRIANGTIEEVLQSHEVNAGDVFFLPAGRVHAIGTGLFIAEIQQNSNITYRLFDYNRKDKQGNTRELHTELAKDAIDYKLYPDLKTVYEPVENDTVSLIECPYFTTNRISLKADETRQEPDGITAGAIVYDIIEMDKDYSDIDSFVIYVCMKGEGTIQYGDGLEESICQGETVLIPACMKETTLCTSSELLLLETYIG